MLYEVAVAFVAREAEKDGQHRQAIEDTLENIDPPEKIEQSRRADGMLEHDPSMEIPNWGFSDPEEMGLGPPASEMFGSDT